MMGLVSKTQVLMLLQAVALLSAKPTTEKVEKEDGAHKAHSQPMYELQLTVWPTDMDDIVDAVAEGPPVGAVVPVVEDPVVVMPDMDDEYDTVEGLDDDLDASPPSLDGGAAAEAESVKVLENYHKNFGNGTEEYKLTLSTGMVNYQRIDFKNINGTMRPVQEGYYTVPTAGVPASYQTIFYHADENGYNVYKTEESPRNPAYDFYLQYAKDEGDKL